MMSETILAGLRNVLSLAQDGTCPWCMKPLGEGKLVIDHDHKTGTIRGLVHASCNGQIGKLESSGRAAKYASYQSYRERRMHVFFDK